MPTGKLHHVSGETILDQYRALIDARLDVLLPQESDLPQELHKAVRYGALGVGKRIRPALTMATCRACGGDPNLALDAGCAVELVHCFSLIHDDLPAIDNDDLRRGRPTCHRVFGEAIAILAGDALFALAFDIVAQAFDRAEAARDAVSILAHASGSHGLVGGEVLDILAEGHPGDRHLLEVIHQRKTGALIGAACALGALAANAPSNMIRDMQRFGEIVGLAFQVADDVLNETSTAEQLGKAVGSDSARSKLTYPGLIGLDESMAEARRLVDEALRIIEPQGEPAHELRSLARYAAGRDR